MKKLVLTLLMTVTVLGVSAPAIAQTATTLLFDGGEAPIGATDFSFEGSNWTGGQIQTTGITSLYASGSFSYHVLGGEAMVTFDEDIESVEFFFAHTAASVPSGTATAFSDLPEGGPLELGSDTSTLNTSGNTASRFVTFGPFDDPINFITFTGAVIDNFTFTTFAEPVGPQPIDDPLPDIPGGISIELETVASGFTAPVGLVFSPDDRMFVVDQIGVITVFDGGTPSTFLDVTATLAGLDPAFLNAPTGVNPFFDERGLLGFAFHPDFGVEKNPGEFKVYTYTSEPVSGSAEFTIPVEFTPNHEAVISEWTVNFGDPNSVDTGAGRRILLRVEEPQFNHDGGHIAFGPDDLLYISLGDGGLFDDEGDGHGVDGNGQDTSTVLGTILRIDVDGSNSGNGEYGIPGDNPFAGGGGEAEIFAYGFRNPYSFSFDLETGDLYVGDVGQNDIEEVDIVVNGGNYGWRAKEGSFFFIANGGGSGFVSDTTDVEPFPSGLIDPIAEYDHDDGIAVIGGVVSHTAEFEALDGHYIFGDLGSGDGRLFYLDENDDILEFNIGPLKRPLGIVIKGFGQDNDGNVYVLGSTDVGPQGTTGVVLKIVSLESLGINVPSLTYAGLAMLAASLALLAAFAIRRRRATL